MGCQPIPAKKIVNALRQSTQTQPHTRAKIPSTTTSSYSNLPKRNATEITEKLLEIQGVDPYQFFGISPNASDDEIKQRYRVLCKQYHPDKNPGIDPSKFQMLTKIYSILKERRAYDKMYGTNLNSISQAQTNYERVRKLDEQIAQNEREAKLREEEKLRLEKEKELEIQKRKEQERILKEEQERQMRIEQERLRLIWEEQERQRLIWEEQERKRLIWEEQERQRLIWEEQERLRKEEERRREERRREERKREGHFFKWPFFGGQKTSYVDIPSGYASSVKQFSPTFQEELRLIFKMGENQKLLQVSPKISFEDLIKKVENAFSEQLRDIKVVGLLFRQVYSLQAEDISKLHDMDTLEVKVEKVQSFK